jgi:hypothetical protein
MGKWYFLKHNSEKRCQKFKNTISRTIASGGIDLMKTAIGRMASISSSTKSTMKKIVCAGRKRYRSPFATDGFYARPTKKTTSIGSTRPSAGRPGRNGFKRLLDSVERTSNIAMGVGVR